MTKSEKQKLLDELKEQMEEDNDLPLKKGAAKLVFGVGNADTEILCIGEGPGYWEDQKGEPFVGNAGKLLDQLLASDQLDRSKVYITNVVHHRPPENRDPEPNEINAYGVYLDKIIAIIDPKIIITLGRYSMAKFLPSARISSVHGKAQKVTWHDKNILVIPMYHPAAALRNGEIMRQEKQDFLKMGETLKNLDDRSDNKVKEGPKGEQLNLI
jgi:uracil-DNA glycosylase